MSYDLYELISLEQSFLYDLGARLATPVHSPPHDQIFTMIKDCIKTPI